MRAFRYSVLCVFLAIVSDAAAQQVAPRVGYVYPAGARRGASVEVKVGGQFLNGVYGARVSGAGVTATVIEHIKPLPPQQALLLRDKLKELRDKRAAALGLGGTTRPSMRPVWTADDEKLMADIIKKLSTFVRRPSSPAIAETVTLRVTVAADAEVGGREIRLLTPAGLTNPLVFQVGQLPEVSKKTAGPVDMQNPNAVRAGARSADMKVDLPAVINGQVMPGDVDRYRFKAKRGQRVVAVVSARALMPYLADAVPGWFQATLGLYDAKGKELAYCDDYRFDPDPVLFCEIPRDGEYVIEIKDAIYRGREDFVYRIAVGELPFITSIFPLGGRPGTTVELKGWNLPAASLKVDAADQPGIVPVGVRRGELVSNRVPFVVDTSPECIEQEPNDSQANAQEMRLPIIVNGRIGKGGDCDVFRFEGRGGQEVVAEVQARRLGSPLDSALTLTDGAGKQIAFNDDHEDKGDGLSTHHADSWLRAKLPADGVYYVHLRDAQHGGGAEYGYRLRISEPRPDFELRMTPSSVSVRAGASVPVTVYAIRKDGFAGQINLALKEAPAGFSLAGARVLAGQDQVRITLTAPSIPMAEPVRLAMEGRAIIGGEQVSRQVVPAEDMMQAFAYRHLVPEKELDVAVLRPYWPRSAMAIASTTPLRIPAGGTARVRIVWPRRAAVGDMQFELSEPPEGVSVRRTSPVRGGIELVLQCDAAKGKPGVRGNLILAAFTERTATARGGKATRQRAAVGVAPAIPFEIVVK